MPELLLLTTALLDPPTALLFGCALALASLRLIRARPDQEVARTALYAAGWSVLYGLAVGYFYFARPNWMLLYLRDVRGLELFASYAVFLAVMAVHGTLGALGGAALLAHGRRNWAWVLATGIAVCLGFVWWLQWEQYTHVGNHAEFLAGSAAPLERDGSMQRAFMLSGLVSAFAAAALLGLRWYQGRAQAGRR